MQLTITVDTSSTQDRADLTKVAQALHPSDKIAVNEEKPKKESAKPKNEPVKAEAATQPDAPAQTEEPATAERVTLEQLRAVASNKKAPDVKRVLETLLPGEEKPSLSKLPEELRAEALAEFQKLENK
jgi:hypothetical protein